jgi:hypothetical protein
MRGNLFSVLLLLLGGLLRAGCALSSGGGSADRKGKFFSIFNIVSFPNSVCNSTVNKTGRLQYKPEYNTYMSKHLSFVISICVFMDSL